MCSILALLTSQSITIISLSDHTKSGRPQTESPGAFLPESFPCSHPNTYAVIYLPTGANPTCFNDTPTTEKATIVLTSHVVYSGLVQPEMRWLGLPGKTETTCADDDRCSSTLRLVAESWMDGRSAVCMTTFPTSVSLPVHDQDNATWNGIGGHNEHAVQSCRLVVSVQC